MGAQDNIRPPPTACCADLVDHMRNIKEKIDLWRETLLFLFLSKLCCISYLNYRCSFIKLQENYVQSHFVRMAQMLNIGKTFEDFSSLEIAIQ